MTQRRPLGQLIRERMESRKLSLRDVDALSRGLAEKQPELYERISRPTLHALIQDEGATRTLSPARLRTLVALLWDGHYEDFVSETGLAIVAPGEEPTTGRVAVTVPVYLEGESAAAGAPRREEPTYPCDMLYVATSRRIRCLPEGEPVGVRATDRIEKGDLVIIERLGNGLEAVWSTESGFVYDDEPAAPPKPSDRVVGVVAWIVPKRTE